MAERDRMSPSSGRAYMSDDTVLDTAAIQAGIGLASDAVADVGGTGTQHAKLRRISSTLGSILTGLGGVVLAAGNAIIGKVGIDQTAGQNVVVLGAGTANVGKVEVSGSLVADRFEGAATVTRTYTGDMNALEICNDGAASMTFTVGSLAGRTFTVMAGEVLNMQFPAFKVVVINTTVAYRCTVFGAVAEVGVSS